ncbi:MAG: flagellar protein FlaG [Rhodocyclaceae bacterium]|nr:flagellar protein FlaG [Rhodocyclaceae bacterium]
MTIQQIVNPSAYGLQGASASTRPAGAKQPAPASAPLVEQPSLPAIEQLEVAVEAVQKAIEPVARDLQFSIDKETGKTIISVVDAATKEVIRQIPGEEILAIARAIDRMQGLLFNQKA